MLLLVPSDHAVANSAAFRKAVMAGAASAEEGNIVTFGIKATRPETGFGWLQSGAETHKGVMKLERFIEKPDAARAVELLADPKYLWNAGVFLARADVLIDAFRTHAPDILAGVEAALAGAISDLDFTRLDEAAWAGVPEESIDYAVMEKATNVSVVSFDEQWSDLGSWESVWQESTKDKNGNARSENTTVFDCENTLLRSESSEIELVGIGLKNVVAVAMRDAVMVADLSESQNVKKAVETLKKRGAKQAVQLPVDHRPWDADPGRPVSGQTHPRPPRRIAESAKPRAPVGTLDRCGGHRAGHRGRRGQTAEREPVGLYPAGRHPPHGKPRQGADGADRGADRHLSG